MKDIPGFEGLYAVTKEGKVWSYPRVWHNGKARRTHDGMFLKYNISAGGYQKVTLLARDAGKHQFFTIHRLVALTYLPNPKNLKEVNHKDTNKQNNNIKNLEWCTRGENAIHASKNGCFRNMPKGEKCSWSKLTEKQVVYIKKNKGKIMGKDLAKKFKVSRATVYDVLNGRRWKHIL